MVEDPSDTDERRMNAAKALGRLGDARAVEPLIGVLRSEPPDYSKRIRGMAAEALGSLGDPRAVEPLIGALGDPGFTSSDAMYALVNIGEPAVESLIAALGDGERSEQVRADAAEALGRIPSGHAYEALAAFENDDSQAVREAVYRARHPHREIW